MPWIHRYLPAAMMVVSIQASAVNLAAWLEVRGGSWTPDAAMLSQLDDLLKPAVQTAAKNRGRMPPWSQYHFQYQGRTSLLGHKYVYVNAFCEDSVNDVSGDWVTVLDGGACYFSAKFDPEAKRVYEVAVNGVA